jgi:hypothetical protein
MPDAVRQTRHIDKTVDGIYFDSVNGRAGTAWPIGTPGLPSSNITDTMAMSVARDLVKINVQTGSTLDMTGGVTCTVLLNGVISITNLTTAITLNAYGDSVTVTIAASCTGGIINLYGDMTVIDNSAGTTVNDYSNKKMGESKVFKKTITSAADAGDVIVATVTAQPIVVDSIVIQANAAQTIDMTSCGVFGGTGKAITFIPAIYAIRANLSATDKQVAWTGEVRLAVGNTIVISLVGTGATAVNLSVSITYHAEVDLGGLD